jgi:hypothetical protein
MSLEGQTLPSRDLCSTAALPLKPDIARRGWDGRRVPQAAVSKCNKLHRYSITSSARASSVVGTLRPSALAVLRLIASRYFVGACTAGRQCDVCAAQF